MHGLVRLWIVLAPLMLLTACGPAPQAKKSGGKKPTPAPAPPPVIPLPKVQQSDFASVDAALAAIKQYSGKNDEAAGRERLKIDLWLGMQGAKIVPELAGKIKDSSADLEIRMAACRVVAKLGPEARPVLMDAVKSDHKLIRVKAAEGLGRLKPPDPATIKKLLELVDDKDFEMRKTALRSLTEIGPPANSATQKLMAIRNDTKEDETIRGLAHSALKKVDPRTGLQKAH